MMRDSQSFLHGLFVFRKVSCILTIYFLYHHLPEFEGLNFSSWSSASHNTGFQTVLLETSQPTASSFSAEVVKFTSQGRNNLEKLYFRGEAQCSAAKGSALWSVDVSDSPGTQERPNYSWSDPDNGGLASKILFPFSALHDQADVLDFIKHAVRCGVWHFHDSCWMGTLSFFTLCEGPQKNYYWPL